jgi:hypothetical protein
MNIPQYNPSSNGTSIQALFNGNKQQPNNQQNSQQNRQSYNQTYNQSYSHNDSPEGQNYRQKNYELEELANDIDEDLENYDNESRKRKVAFEDEIDFNNESLDSVRSARSNQSNLSNLSVQSNQSTNTKKQKIKYIKKTEKTNYAKIILEPLILLTVYVILSQPFIYSILSNYIKYLKEDENGDIGLTGVIIYGIVLVLLFLLLRHIVYSRL